MNDRIIGGMLGLAIGDAMGASVEFLERGTFEYVDNYRSGGVFGLLAGTHTDDTSMALCLSKSLIEKGFNPFNQMDMYCTWLHEGLFACDNKPIGLGETVRLALLQYLETNQPYAGQTQPNNASNGALSRLFPLVAYCSNKKIEDVLELAKLSTLTTHGLDICVEASAYFSAILYGSLQGKSKEEILSSNYEAKILSKLINNEAIMDIYKSSYKDVHENKIHSSGYVVDSLIAALWAFENTSSFKEGLLKAVNLGGDADTIGAIYGQLAGSYYGACAIDNDLINGLRYNKAVSEMAIKLLNCIPAQ